ncbi:hypothetical protein GCM10027348_40530 [Hymenobacter tenuis]
MNIRPIRDGKDPGLLGRWYQRGLLVELTFLAQVNPQVRGHKLPKRRWCKRPLFLPTNDSVNVHVKASKTGTFTKRIYLIANLPVLPMLFGYVRVSTSAQSAESQKSLIARYLVEHRWTLDEWIEVEMSSRRTAGQRRLPELLAKVGLG